MVFEIWSAHLRLVHQAAYDFADEDLKYVPLKKWSIALMSALYHIGIIPLYLWRKKVVPIDIHFKINNSLRGKMIFH